MVLTVTAASGPDIERGQLTARITGARKIGEEAVATAIGELIAAGLPQAGVTRLRLTDAGQARVREIRGPLGEITARLFGDLPEDLETAGRVLAIVTQRANAELTSARDEALAMRGARAIGELPDDKPPVIDTAADLARGVCQLQLPLRAT
jgi:hypothetical protein